MRSFIKHFTEKWLRYLIALLLIFIFWLVTVDALVAVKPENKIGIFIGSYGVSPSFEESIEKPDGIEEIGLYDLNIGEDYYFVIFDAYASNNDFDFSIVNEKQFRESDIQYYLPLDEKLIVEYFGEREYYRVNGDIYGIKIYDADVEVGILTDVISYEDEGAKEDYYLFFHNNSLHLGELNSSEDDRAIEIIRNLLEEINGENQQN